MTSADCYTCAVTGVITPLCSVACPLQFPYNAGYPYAYYGSYYPYAYGDTVSTGYFPTGRVYDGYGSRVNGGHPMGFGGGGFHSGTGGFHGGGGGGGGGGRR